jgi:hypothetical protein
MGVPGLVRLPLGAAVREADPRLVGLALREEAEAQARLDLDGRDRGLDAAVGLGVDVAVPHAARGLRGFDLGNGGSDDALGVAVLVGPDDLPQGPGWGVA